MKANKHKRVKRTLDFYRQLVNLTVPYRILVDGSFAFAALKHKVNIKEHLTELLGDTTHTYVTSCIIDELRGMGEEMSGAVLALKRCQRLRCNHQPSDKAPNSRRCITSAVSDGNPQKLFVATQDQTMISWLRENGCVPILKFNNNIVFLEHPPRHSQQYKDMVEKEKLLPKKWETSFLPAMKEANKPVTKRKPKKPKNPNPLSCLKRKKKADVKPKKVASSDNETTRPKRIRKRRNKGNSTSSTTVLPTNDANNAE
ncbi:PIN_Fcf1-like RNA pre-processing family member [Babesia bovis T2Bo]|uniref:UTP23 sensor motif region domain-containing protein n=1 Tax=Babesia bovis TaxID=5865 RepID=A7AMI7_BABBO|nr:PIN_Fcf1-like RNA pre-processing family member [Babesia bovis T2Bo]EDO07771.1 PIN_Fcf1-like RNA pre-processing family member [Babesia bovis T2Bo]|eukprot:XP_001611339.1 hypothetical protein [Babesia bovis T2Bo]